MNVTNKSNVLLIKCIVLNEITCQNTYCEMWSDKCWINRLRKIIILIKIKC